MGKSAKWRKKTRWGPFGNFLEIEDILVINSTCDKIERKDKGREMWRII